MGSRNNETSSSDPNQLFLASLGKAFDRFAEPHPEQPVDAFGLPSLDSHLLGLPRGAFTIIGGYPGVGKLDLCLQACTNLATQYAQKVLIINFRHRDIVERMCLSFFARIRYEQTKRVDPELLLNQVRQTLANAQIGTLDWSSRNINPRYIYDQLARTVHRYKPNMLVINDIQQIVQTVNTNSSMYAEVSIVGRAMHRVAREFDISLLCLSKLNRRTRGLADPRPELYSLADAGCLEEDAAAVLLLHRVQRRTNNQEVEINIAKSAHLPPNVRLKFGYSPSEHLLYEL